MIYDSLFFKTIIKHQLDSSYFRVNNFWLIRRYSWNDLGWEPSIIWSIILWILSRLLCSDFGLFSSVSLQQISSWILPASKEKINLLNLSYIYALFSKFNCFIWLILACLSFFKLRFASCASRRHLNSSCSSFLAITALSIFSGDSFYCINKDKSFLISLLESCSTSLKI